MELAWELSLEGFGFDPEQIWITVFEGDEELGLGPGRGGHRGVAVGRRAARADRAVQPRGELLAGRADRAVRPVLGALPRPRGRVREARRSARRRERALPRVLEPRVHAVQPGPGERPRPAAQPEHRHRARAQPHGADPAGHADDLRDGPVPAADPAGGGAVGPPLRRVGRRRPRAAHPRRPHARHVLPGRRRRRALQRGPRLRAAPPDAPRGAAGAADRRRGRRS